MISSGESFLRTALDSLLVSVQNSDQELKIVYITTMVVSGMGKKENETQRWQGLQENCTWYVNKDKNTYSFAESKIPEESMESRSMREGWWWLVEWDAEDRSRDVEGFRSSLHESVSWI